MRGNGAQALSDMELVSSREAKVLTSGGASEVSLPTKVVHTISGISASEKRGADQAGHHRQKHLADQRPRILVQGLHTLGGMQGLRILKAQTLCS